jgi:hypothetical protein
VKTPKKPNVSDAPMALASDGSLLLNVAMTNGPTDPKSLLERALAQGSQVFIGVVATPSEVTITKKWMADSTVEIVGALWGGAGRRRPRTRSR